MNEMLSLAADVDWPDSDAASSARATLAAAGDDVGRLGELAEWLASVQGKYPPHDFARVRTIVFGAESAAPEATAGLASIADLAGSGLRAVVRKGQPTAQAIVAGATLADEEVDSGADLLVVALKGPDSGTTSLALVSVLTNTEPVKVMPRGARLIPDEWMQQAVEVRDMRRRGMPHRAEPAELLEAMDGPDIAAAAGFLLRAAGRRTPVLLDGLPATTAALAAYEAQPRAVRWWNCADASPDPAHELALSKLGKSGVLNLGIGLADGTAGLLAVPVLRAAARTLARLAATAPAAPTAPDAASDADEGGDTAPS